MHVGSVRTALFAWLLARQNDGAFILRLEDTDQKREVAGSAEHIATTLNALGLHYTEGPGVGGPHGPYKQSERLAIYKEWAQKLIDSGRAYADPYTTDQLTEFRDAAKAEKRAFLYRDHRPENPLEWDGSTPLRFKSEPQSYQWHDEVMGNLSTGPEVVDDFILIKSDGFPTYNFAHIVDDAEMQISHVIRGQEFISSMANYLNLYDALGIEWPVFATMPHIMAEAGNKKLGKRWVEISTKYFHSSRSENHIKNRWYSASFKKFISNEFGPEAYASAKGAGKNKDKKSKKLDADEATIKAR
jgi:glutamyl-tRNA synthetase